jgi:hypothetical protein
MAFNDVKVKTKIQKLLDSNTVRAGGDFYSDELDEDAFVHDFEKCLKLIPKEKCESASELLESVIKKSTVKVRGMINSRELKQSKFFRELFKSFNIELL